MPTILRVGPYRFYFYANEGFEPAHVHVERETHHAKFWLDPVRLSDSMGFGRKELHKLRGIVVE
jgi:hypothetical protein